MMNTLSSLSLLWQFLAALAGADSGPVIGPDGGPYINPNGLEGEGEGGPYIDPDG